jgi:hypothetical protein
MNCSASHSRRAADADRIVEAGDAAGAEHLGIGLAERQAKTRPD